MGTKRLSWGYSSRCVAQTIQLHLALKLKKEYRYTYTPHLGPRGLFYFEIYHTSTGRLRGMFCIIFHGDGNWGCRGSKTHHNTHTHTNTNTHTHNTLSTIQHLWAPVPEISTYQHTILITEKQPCPRGIRTRSPYNWMLINFVPKCFILDIVACKLQGHFFHLANPIQRGHLWPLFFSEFTWADQFILKIKRENWIFNKFWQ